MLIYKNSPSNIKNILLGWMLFKWNRILLPFFFLKILTLLCAPLQLFFTSFMLCDVLIFSNVSFNRSSLKLLYLSCTLTASCILFIAFPPLVLYISIIAQNYYNIKKDHHNSLLVIFLLLLFDYISYNS